MHFYVSMNRFGLMNVLMNSNLHTTEDKLMTYLFCFVHLFTNFGVVDAILPIAAKHTGI